MRESITILKVDEFDRLCALHGWDTDHARARGLGLSQSQVTRVRRGTCSPGARFIANALRKFSVEYSHLFGGKS